MSNQPENYGPDINPATGLPMIDETYIDVGGNPYGSDLYTSQPYYDPSPYYPPAPSCFDDW